jgi:dsDNA-binding SOS-regulon protein
LSDEFDAKGEDIKEGYQLPSREWCEWIDNLEAYMKKRNNDEDMLVHEKEETEWFDKMHPQREALDTFYPAEEDEEGEEDEEDEAAPMAATSNQQLRKRMKKRQRRGEK